MGVVSLPLPIQPAVASWERPHSPSWLVATYPQEGRVRRSQATPCSLFTLRAHVPEEEAALLSPCSPLWPQWDLGWSGGMAMLRAGTSGWDRTESVRAREDGSA